MATYGVTPEGFVQKRFPEILTDDRNQAVSIFQDQVAPGDVVDVSDSAALGRLISLKAPSAADLWEALQGTYSAFDPNSATGIALDNLVALAGITRKEQTFSTARILVSGDVGTLIPQGSVVSSTSTGEKFDLISAIGFSNLNASGIEIEILTVSDSTLYSISYSNTTTTQNINFTSDSSATESEILNGIKTIIDGSHPSLNASITGNILTIRKNDPFQTVSFTISSNIGFVKIFTSGQVIAENSGPIEQEINTITTIQTPVLGWDTVTNPIAASPGTERETDEELRERFRNSKFERATNSIDAIYSALLNIENIEEVIVLENDTDFTDSNGIPPHSFLPIVLGGLGTDIVNAIWENKPAGILSYGNTTIPVIDIQGYSHNISYQTPSPVVIYISMNLTTDSNFPANGEDLIKDSIIEYFRNNFGIGDDVIYSRLYTPINSIPGHQINSLTLGTTPSPVGTSNISIDFDEIASVNDLNIIITT